MKVSHFFEVLSLSLALWGCRVLGFEVSAPIFLGLFLGGVILLYGLGQAQSDLRWRLGPPILRSCCWFGYLVLLCNLGSNQIYNNDSDFLAPSFVLSLALLANCRWALTRCSDASRRHVTDGRFDLLRNQALAVMLRAIGLAGGAGIVVAIWFAYFSVRTVQGLSTPGQDLMTLTLLIGLLLSESVTALVFGERVCSCCATPPASAQIMFSRAVGLCFVACGWGGVLQPAEMMMYVGSILYALAVISSGSPASLPIQFRPLVKNQGRALQAMYTSVALNEIREDIDTLKLESRATRSRLTQQFAIPDPLPQTAPHYIRELLHVPPLTLEVGRALDELVSSGRLGQRIRSIQRHVFRELGLPMQNIQVRTNLQLRPTKYRVRLFEIDVASADVRPEHFLAIGPEDRMKTLIGERAVDPTYGMPGVWVDATDKKRAEELGCMIFDVVSVLATHLTESIRTNSSRLLGMAEVHELLENLSNPILRNAVVPDKVSLVELRDILRSLLSELVPIRALSLILEVLAGLDSSLSTEQKVEWVRIGLGGQISQEYKNNQNTIIGLALCPRLEQRLVDLSTDGSGRVDCVGESGLLPSTIEAISLETSGLVEKGLQPIIVVSHKIRLLVKNLTRHSIPSLVVLSYAEIASVEVHFAGAISISD